VTPPPQDTKPTLIKTTSNKKLKRLSKTTRRKRRSLNLFRKKFMKLKVIINFLNRFH
jgi:hypothetical protein